MPEPPGLPEPQRELFPKSIRGGFDNVPDLYDRARPTYPAEAFDEIFSRLPEAPSIVEVGPGTGQATRDLLARHAHVTAVELGPAMAERLRSNFPTEGNLDVVVSSFEAAPLPTSHFNGLFSATAYWWVSPPERLAKPVEILKPNGVIAILDTMQVDATNDRGYFERSHSIYERHGEAARGGYQPAARPNEVVPPILHELRGSSLYRNVELFRYRWDQTYTTAEYADLLRTYSGTQAMVEEAREALIADLANLIDSEFDGIVTRPLVMTLVVAGLA